MVTRINYTPAPVRSSDPQMLGQQLTYEHQNIANAISQANLQVTQNGTDIATLLSRASVKLQFISRSMTAASGNVSYTGVGFKPSLVLFVGNISTAQLGTIGFDDGVNPRCYVQTSGSWSTDGAASVFFSADNGTTNQVGNVVSFDADGFTLSWVKTGSPAAGNGFFSALSFR